MRMVRVRTSGTCSPGWRATSRTAARARWPVTATTGTQRTWSYSGSWGSPHTDSQYHGQESFPMVNF